MEYKFGLFSIKVLFLTCLPAQVFASRQGIGLRHRLHQEPLTNFKLVFLFLMNLFAIHFCNLPHDFHSFFSLAHGQKPSEEILKLKEEYCKNISPAGFWHDHWGENHKSHLREKKPVEDFPISKSLHKPWLVHSGHSEGQGQADVSN